jgi:hypothetical protein
VFSDGKWVVNTSTAVPSSGTLTAPSADGKHSVGATVIDAAGNASPDATDNEFWLDTNPVINSAGELLAFDGYRFAEGVDVQVNGTAFLGGSAAPNVSAAAALFADADVTMSFTGNAGSGDITAIIAGGDDYLDDLTANLIASGVDSVSLTSAQVTALVNANATLTNDLSFGGGIDVHVSGTGFLAASTVGNPVSALFAPNADITVDLASGAAVSQIVALGTPTERTQALDQLVDRLQAAGVDNIELSDDQVASLATAGAIFDASTPVGVVVHGTSFLSAPATSVAALFSNSDKSAVTLQLDDAHVDAFLAAPATFDSTLEALDARGVDAVQLDVGQALQLSDAQLDFSVNPGLDVVVQGTHFLDKGLSSGSDLFTDGGSVSKLWLGGPNTPPLPPLPPLQGQADINGEFGPSAFAQVLTEEPVGADVAALEDALSMPDPFQPGDDVLAAVDMLVDTIASEAYVDIMSTDDLSQALQDVGLGSGVVADNPLADLMALLAAAPSAANPLQAEAEPLSGLSGLAEGLAAGMVSDAGDLASLLDPAAVDSPHHDAAVPTAQDTSALLATLAGQQGGVQVQVLGGMDTAATDPFDPFDQQHKT